TMQNTDNARGNKWLWKLARMAPGATPGHTNVMLPTLRHRLAAQYTDDYLENTGWHFSVDPMLAAQTKDVRRWLFLAFGAVGCILLIACTNVSGLLLVRSSVRSRELAVRSALGASSGRLLQQILTETGLFIAIGCCAGLGLAVALVHLSNTYGPIDRTQIEPWALALALGLCIISTFLAGLLPAILSSRLSPEQALRAGA